MRIPAGDTAIFYRGGILVSQPASENKMGVMPENKLLLNMALPMIISMLIQACYNIVDSYFVSKLSEDALNAVSLAFPVQNLMIAVAVGTGVGINALLSRSLGQKDFDRANRTAMNGLLLEVVSGLVFTALGLTCARLFYTIQTDIPGIIAYGVDYLTIIAGCSMGIFVSVATERLVQATGRTVYAMVIQGTGSVINLILDPILIFGLFGFPRLEVAGAAVATVTGQIIGGLVGLYLSLTRNPELQMSFRGLSPSREIVGGIYSVGLPSIIMQSIGSVMVFGMNKILMGFTDTATAVFGAYFKLQSFIFMPVFGLNNGMVPIISYNYGAARLDRVRDTIKLTATVATVIMVAGCAALNLIPGLLLGFFSPSAEMLSIGTVALRVISYSFLLAGFDIIAGSVCQAIGNPVHTLICSVCRQLAALLPAAWLLAQTGVLDLVWFCFPISEVVSLVLSIIFLRRTMRRVEAQIGHSD